MQKVSIETEYDKIVKNLAESKVCCVYKVDNKICDKANCVYCNVRIKQDMVYNNLSAVDQLAVDTRIESLLSLILNNKHKGHMPSYFKIIFKCLKIIFLSYLFYIAAILIRMVLRWM